MKSIGMVVLAAGMVLLPQLLDAQTASLGSFNSNVMQVQPAVPDSIVQITAEAQGLELVPPAEVPPFGSFWVVEPGTGLVPVPWPCPPVDPTLPVYSIVSGIYLVDGTGGQVLPARLQAGRMATSALLNSALEAQASTVVNLIAQVQDAQLNQDLNALFGMDSADSGGGFSPNGLSSTTDYGTNLWIAQPAVTSGYLTGIGTNTQADIQYEIQSHTNLAQADWQSEGFILGSELTNWTPLSVARGSRTNLFIRLKSWADSVGSGLPDWWQLQYFSTNGVDPYGNPKGDGWSNLQKFQNGMNPNSFYTPAAPQGFTVRYNANNSTATLKWLTAPGNVTGYTVAKTYTYASTTTTQNIPVSGNTYSDNVSANQPNPRQGGTISVSYTVQAQYAGGNSAVSAATPLEAPSFAGIISGGFQGVALLTVAAMPANTTGIRLTEINWNAIDSGNFANAYVTNFVVPVNNPNNPAYSLANVETAIGNSSFAWVGQAVTADGGLTATANLNETSQIPGNTTNTWMVTPFYDGRAQLKQNLVFQLRVADVVAPFGYSTFYYDEASGAEGPDISLASPTNYVYAGYYDINNFNLLYGSPSNTPTLNICRPFEDNYSYRNFVFNSQDTDTSGNLTTGVEPPPYFLNDTTDLAIWLPPAYAPGVNVAGSTPLLATNLTRWLACFPANLFDNNPTYDPATDTYYLFYHTFSANFNNTEIATFKLLYNVSNYWGLPFVSAKTFYSLDGVSYVNTVLNRGDSFTAPYPGPTYMETAQPIFQTVEFDFWKASNTNIPGNNVFSIANTGDQIITGVGQGTQIAGYAKLALQNGHSSVFGYLGQYFDKAYTMANGVATTNSTGVLSPYGQFFATEPGPTALVTMPDVDTGERGTCTVYSVSLQLDANHDGNMDLSFNGADATSPNSPFVFWINNNHDRSLYDADDAANYEDDLDSIDVAKLPLYQRVPDYNYTNYDGYRAIPSKRDLEDFTRLWVCGITTNLLANLPNGSTVTLSWGDTDSPNSANPTIDLFQAADPNGGIGYLTNETSAAAQTNLTQGRYVGRLKPGGSIQLNSLYVPSLWAGDRFIWCGVARGNGSLILTIADANSNMLAQSAVNIQIKDIKEMYERWTVGEEPGKAPLTVAVKAANDLPTSPIVLAFEYPTTQATNTPYILFVHGWNMRTDDKDHFAESAFKRLYWQGYQGRFGSFRWPTDYGFGGFTSSAHNPATDPRNFDNSEFQAWKSGIGLKNMLTRLNILYPNNVYLMAHSMGNIVAGEALKQAGNSPLVNTYVAMQGAVASHAYDPGTPWRTIPYLLDSGTLERYTMYWTNGADCYFNGLAGAGTYVNFFNTNDFALRKWQINQNLKPDSGYSVTLGESYYYNPLVGSSRQLYFPADTYEIFSYITEARCFALGAQADVGGVFKLGQTYQQVNLPSVWPTDPLNLNYTVHFWHSAEFRADNTQSVLFWNAFLTTCKLK